MAACRVLAAALVLAAVLATARTAGAGCPLSAGSEPPTGFLARVATAIMPPPAAVQGPRLIGRLGAAAEARMDSAELGARPLVATVAGEGYAAGGGWRSCMAGALSLDPVESGTASAGVLVPLTLTGISLGGTLDHQREVGLAARPERLRRRVSALHGQVGLSFVDLPLTADGVTLRTQVMPVHIAATHDLQAEGDGGGAGRRHMELGVAMFRFVAEEAGDRGTFDVFAFDGEWVELDTPSMDPVAPTAAEGFATLSPLRFSRDAGRWHYALDAGFLVMMGAIDCETTRCMRGTYDLALGHRLARLELRGRLARSAFVAWTGGVGFEDRLTGEVTTGGGALALTGESFVARSRSWTGGPSGITAGAGAALSYSLGGGFAALGRAELARSYYARVDGAEPVIEPALRLGAALSWRGELSR